MSGNKKCDLIHMKELLPTTGYIRGGCSPVGMKKPFPTYFDRSCTDYDYIYVSAGQRGLQLKSTQVTSSTMWVQALPTSLSRSNKKNSHTDR